MATSPTADPIGALIYYLCVTTALKSGHFDVPTSTEVSVSLMRHVAPDAVLGREGLLKDEGEDAIWIKNLWDDMSWVNKQELLLEEAPIPAESFNRSMSQPEVNKRIRSFDTGFDHSKPRQRKIVPSTFVEHPITALQLMVFKDLYMLSKTIKIRPRAYLELLMIQDLVSTAQEFYTFIKSMRKTGYLEFEPNIADDLLSGAFFWIEPGLALRNQDLYLELRALDHYATVDDAVTRRQSRLDARTRVKSLFDKTPIGMRAIQYEIGFSGES